MDQIGGRGDINLTAILNQIGQVNVLNIEHLSDDELKLLAFGEGNDLE